MSNSHQYENQSRFEAQLDHIVDTEGVSYNEAYRKLGIEAPDNSDFTAEAIESRLGPTAMGQFVELDTASVEPHDGSNPKHGIDRLSWQRNNDTPEQQERINRGIAEAREAMRHNKES